MNKFWMVIKEDSPTCQFRHETLESAKSEAERLCRLERGKRFFVLEAIAVAQIRDIDWEELPMIYRDPIGSDIPF